ncbi:MAG: hypothetical protein A3K06_00035 [Candidatus Doudnabacteria bacterium RIFCSPHIGHO2_01_52_17]|uniref:Uncharacterized protein n=1 Tax=Candidatus Doudnabacteria bacterium RIFCSPHIGHO2_01_52_17 TaxID=1817820 RepID=A0A1F5ND17_9BACT|nr:MAG: hypothetical protein A3K06_00035 [Candidatus Doudnabacteria bacterium RIFCSPHIGHO2_01_52_17]
MAETATSTKIPPLVVSEEGAGAPPPDAPVAPATGGDNIWDKVIKGFIYALALCLPLLFTGWTFEPLEFSKQMLLYVLVSGATITWLLKLLVERRVRFVKTPLDLPIGIFLLIYFLASVFSVDRTASFLGSYGIFSGSFFEILFLAILYYIVVNNFTDLQSLKKLFGIFNFSVFLALLYIVLQFFGLYIIPLEFAKTNGFNSIGGILMLSLFSAFAVVLSLGQSRDSWFSVFGGKAWRIGAAVLAFIVLLTVNFVYAWVGLLVGVVLHLVFQMGYAKNFSMRRIVAPLGILVAVIAFLLTQLVFGEAPFRSLLDFNLPQEVRLDYQTSLPVITGAVGQRPILGFGPSTFSYAFSKNKSTEFNLTEFWNVRFERGPSLAAENLVGSGTLGFLAFETLLAMFLIYAWLFLLRRRNDPSWDVGLGSLAGFSVLWFAHWFFFFSGVIYFSLWLMLAVFMAATRIAGVERLKVTSFSFASSPRQTVSVVTVVSISLVAFIVFLFFATAVYASDIFYRNALRAAQNPDTYGQAGENFERTIRLNRFRPDYYLSYGEFLFLRINEELAKKEPNLGLIQSWLRSSIEVSSFAVDLSPASWSSWERLATLYTYARPLVAGVDEKIIESLRNAVQNDSNNPTLHTELGQAYRLAATRLDPSILGDGVDSDDDGLSDTQEQALGSNPSDPDTNGNKFLDGNEVIGGLNPAGSGQLPADFLSRYVRTDQEKLLLAVDEFKKAIELKSNYAVPYYQLALTYERQNKMEDAIATLNEILKQYPNDVVLKYELGRMYYAVGQYDQAAGQFQAIVRGLPDYSDALFYYGASLEQLGRLPQALEQYRRILELNPGNQFITAKVQQLEAAVNSGGNR